jgi:hypothetical protein
MERDFLRGSFMGRLMTTHYYKTLKELTAEEIWTAAKMHIVWNDGRSYIPNAYGEFSEADKFAYDAWRYLDYLVWEKSHNVIPRTPEQWCEALPVDTPERKEKIEFYIKLLKEVVKGLPEYEG